MNDVTGSKGTKTRDRILDVAEKLILRHGYSGTAIDEIIEQAHITKGGFFYHFESKLDLARALLDRYRERDAELFSSLMGRARSLIEDPLQQMLLFINLFSELFAESLEEHPGCLSASFAYEDYQFNDDIRALNQQNLGKWREIFAEQLHRVAACYPMAIETDIETLADMLATNIQGGLVLAIVHGDHEIPLQQLRQYRNYLRLLFEPAPAHKPEVAGRSA
jgi:AcrR family transcriptional regulator